MLFLRGGPLSAINLRPTHLSAKMRIDFIRAARGQSLSVLIYDRSAAAKRKQCDLWWEQECCPCVAYKLTWLPGLTRRSAASAHRWAAWMTSAFRPVMGFSCADRDAVGEGQRHRGRQRHRGALYLKGWPHLTRSHNEAVSDIGNEAVHVNPEVATRVQRERADWTAAAVMIVWLINIQVKMPSSCQMTE